MLVEISGGRFLNDQTAQTKIIQIIEHNVWKFRNESIDKFESKIDSTYEKIKNIGGFEQLVEKYDFISDLSPEDHPEIYQKYTKNNFLRYVKKKFFKTRKYSFYYPLGEIQYFQTSIEIGYCKILTFNKLPQQVQKFFIKTWNGEYDYRPEYITDLKEIIKQRKKYVFLKFEILSVGVNRTQDYAQSIVNESLHILRYVSNTDCGTLEPTFSDNRRNYYKSFQIGNVITRVHSFNKNMKNEIKILTEIFQKEPKNDLEIRIESAITMSGIAIQMPYPSVRLMMLCSALETLLLFDRGNIGYKLAERVAFLIKTEKKRIDVFTEINELYGKRSTYTHKGKEGVTEEEVQKLTNYFKIVIEKIIELRKKGYEKVIEPNDKKSISYLLNMIKFRHKIK